MSSLRKLALISSGAKGKNVPNKILTDKELYLYKCYESVLRLRNTNQALREGLFYDLMYVNYDGSEGFDPQRHFAFLRRGKDELLLCVANFSDKDADCGVRIPMHAFDFLSMTSGNFSSEDILSGEKTSITLTPDAFTQVKVGANKAILLSVKC